MEAARRRRATWRTAVAEELSRLGARRWQIEIMAPMLTQAIARPSRSHSRRRPTDPSAQGVGEGLVVGEGVGVPVAGSNSGTDAWSIALQPVLQRQDHRLVEQLGELARRRAGDRGQRVVLGSIWLRRSSCCEDLGVQRAAARSAGSRRC